MTEIDFELPNGVTVNITKNTVDEEENPQGNIIGKVSCPDCDWVVKSIIYDNFGRFSGKIVINNNNTVWQGKLASNPEKSKKQLQDMFNQRVIDHLNKCGKKK